MYHDARLIYHPDEVRTALYVACQFGGDTATCATVAMLLGLDARDLGHVIAGWPVGTMTPPDTGWRCDVSLFEQREE